MDRDTNKIKKPARRDLEARKEQNRNASRNYREKRKQRLSLLNQLLDPSNVVGISEAGGSASQDISRQPMLDVPVDSFVPDTAFATYNAVDSFGNNWVHSDPVVKIPMSNQIALSFATPWPLGDPQSLQVPQRFTSIVPTEPTPDTSNSRSLNHSNSPGRDTAFQNVLTSVDSLSLSEKRSIIRHLQQTTDTPPPTPTGNQTRLQVESLLFAQAISRAGPRSPPSQYANGAGIYGAVFANCYALGMGSVDEIMAEDGCSLFSVTPDQGHDRAVLPTVKAKFSGLSIHLQPSEGQLTFGHHPYIDVIPFTSFRQNLIEALEHDPPLFDEDVFCHDMLVGGFVCWGSSRTPLGMDAAVPWDARSWEPAVWFLQKYRHLTGGWDGEMWKSARWWHGIRGERMQIGQTMGYVDGSFACSR